MTNTQSNALVDVGFQTQALSSLEQLAQWFLKWPDGKMYHLRAMWAWKVILKQNQ